MPRRKKSPLPTFVPWGDGDVISLRHHDHDLKIGRIELLAYDGAQRWRLSWKADYLPATWHDDAQAAAKAASDTYAAFLLAEREAHRDSYEEWEYQDRFTRRQASAVARAVRVPMGGQRGWTPAPNGDPA